ncbi:type 1 glutamine amidotransferase domain-containing protein [Pseudomonas sp. QE6]|uniref:type 1 glutamine amidotransferase domain-containing protein n=1 Tax=Pseudomonas sp. QE6 TaxID=3242491 RepID=UPI0035297303
MSKRILHVVTNVAHYADPSKPTGLWLGELTHAYHVFAANGYEQHLVSPRGGVSPLEPRSLKWPLLDRTAKAWLNDEASMLRLSTTAQPEEIDSADFDVIYFTGGHAVMWDFPDDAGLQRLTREIYERGGIVSSVCHGYCGLLNTQLSDGHLLVAGRRLTGYSWNEEVLAGVARQVPYNSEAEMKRRGARYEKALLPFVSNVVVDGRLVTGQNPQSAKETAERVVALLK